MEPQTITLSIDNISVTAPEGSSILKAALGSGIHIPSLCYHPCLDIAGNCRVCVVEIRGQKELAAACATPVREGMEVYTHSQDVRVARRQIVELLLSEHNADCTKCYRNGSCELQTLAGKYHIGDHLFIDLVKEADKHPDASSPWLVRDASRCIRCQRCVRVCTQVQKVGTLAVAYKGSEQKITTFCEKPLNEVFCIGCGLCALYCPTASITERSNHEELWDVLSDNRLHVLAAITPEAINGLCAALGLPSNKGVHARIIAALKQIGFSAVADYGFFSDLYALELCTELLQSVRRQTGTGASESPLFTSFSPAWVNLATAKYPQARLSKVANPGMLFASLAREWYPDQKALDRNSICSVLITPCVAARQDARQKQGGPGAEGPDFVITTREILRMIRQAGIDVNRLPEDDFDEVFAGHSGAADIAECPGGIAESCARTLAELVSGTELDNEGVDFYNLRGKAGIRELSLSFGEVRGEWEFLRNKSLNIAVVDGVGNIPDLMKKIKEGSIYHLVDVKACPGGCPGGGGNIIHSSETTVQERNTLLYRRDEQAGIRMAHSNRLLAELYRLFLKSPGGDIPLKILRRS